MDYEKHKYILTAVRSLREAKSWTGRTHIQKTLAMASGLLGDRLPFEFVLFKHGPYSFEADTEMDQMLTYDAITAMAMEQYGASYKPGSGSIFVDQSGEGNSEVTEVISKVAKFVRSRNVVELEALATSVWIRTRENLTTEADVKNRLNELKPHLSQSNAMAGVTDSSTFLNQLKL